MKLKNLLFLSLLFPSFTISAQVPVPDTTVFTRGFLKSTNQAAAQSYLGTGGGGSGTVTSVSGPSTFTWATATTTPTATWNAQAAGTLFGNGGGSTATPAFSTTGIYFANSLTLSGTLNSASLGVSGNGSISDVIMNSTGISESGNNNWAFNSDGSGNLAGNFITWDTSGNLTAVSFNGSGSGLSANSVPNSALSTLVAIYSTPGTFASTTTFGGGIAGTTLSNNASSGNLGEYVQTLVAQGSAVTCTTTVVTNVAQVILSAGDWDVEGNVNITNAAATVTQEVACIWPTTLTAAGMSTDGSEVLSGVTGTLVTSADSITLPRKRINTGVTTTNFLAVKVTFSAGTVKAYGQINARRIR